MSSLPPQERDALLDQFEALAEDAPFQLLTRRHMDRLIALESGSDAIISLYLDLGPQARQDRAWAIQLKNMSRDALAAIADPRLARSVGGELERIDQALAQSMPDLGRGVAMFVSQPLGLWYQVALPLPLPNRLKIEERPYLRPLFRVLDEHERFVLALLDNQRARLFVSQLGFIEEVADLFGEVPARHSQGGWAQMRLQRRRDAHIQWHAGAVAHAAALAMEYFNARWLLLSASPEANVDFRKSLPATVASKLAGSFVAEAVSTASQVAGAAVDAQRQVEAREEMATVRALGDLPAGTGKALGLADTLACTWEGRVKTLVLLDDYRARGGMCSQCELVVVRESGDCPACGAPLRRVDDVVDLALEKAYRQSASLELVRSSDARDRLAELAPIGALLRY